MSIFKKLRKAARRTRNRQRRGLPDAVRIDADMRDDLYVWGGRHDRILLKRHKRKDL